MAYHTAASRASSKSPVGVENRGRGVRLHLDTNAHTNGKLNGEASSFLPATGNNRFLLHDSEIEGPLIVRSTPADGPAGKQTKGDVKAGPSPIGTPNSISPTRAKTIFSTDVVPGKFIGSHLIKIEVARTKYAHLFDELTEAFDWDKSIHSFFTKMDPEGKMITAYVVFDDVRRAATAQDHVSVVETSADVSYVMYQEFAGAQREHASSQASMSFYDGQVIFFGTFDGPITTCKADGLEDQVRNLAQSYGDLLAFGEMNSKDGFARFRGEFKSIKAAKEVVRKLTSKTPAAIGGWFIFAKELPDVNSSVNSDKGTGTAGRGTPAGSADDSSPTFVSPTGRTTWACNDKTGEVWSLANNGVNRNSPTNGAPITVLPIQYSPPPMQFVQGNQHIAGPQYSSYAPQQYGQISYQQLPAQHHNGGYPQQFGHGRHDFADSSQAVDPENIRRGLDVRTTIMLRNLPNQMTCHKLKELLDHSNFGEYDFSYVRIDYEKNASVGYGFVNFVDPAAIIKFLHAYANRPWMPELPNRRGAARLAEVSYATVQGYDCCIEKFRNSSVMTECPDYRPKLWQTIFTAPTKQDVGTEIDFPPVNNVSKHQRSLANATQIGLFPPQSRRGPGGHYRQGTRSQWDRGTTAQQQEDQLWMMQNQMQQMQLAPAGQVIPSFAYGVAPGGNYPVQPMPQQPVPVVIGYDPYGNPVFGNPAPVVAPNGYHGQMQPNLANGNGYGPNTAHGRRFPGRGHQGSNRDFRAATVPRTLYNPCTADDDPNAYEGDVDVADMMGYYNPKKPKQDQQD